VNKKTLAVRCRPFFQPLIADPVEGAVRSTRFDPLDTHCKRLPSPALSLNFNQFNSRRSPSPQSLKPEFHVHG
jgi:hypothetical protein